MKIKAFILSIVVLFSTVLSGCSFDDYQENLRLFNEFINTITYFYQGNGGENESGDVNQGGENIEGDQDENGNDKNQDEETKPIDYLDYFKTMLDEGKSFILTKTVQTEYSETDEVIYFAGAYVYKVSKITSNASFTLHKLYLDSGLTYVYNGSSVAQDKTVDFTATKTAVLDDLFHDSIVWEKVGDGYVYKNGEFDYHLFKGETEESLKYEIFYSSNDTWAIYKGEITLYNNLTVSMPIELKQFI